MLKVQLKDKVVRLTKLNETQGNVCILSAILKLMSHSLWTFSVLKKLPCFVTFYYVNLLYCLLNCITETIQVTKGHKHFPWGPRAPHGPHVASPDIINNTWWTVQISSVLITVVFHPHVSPCSQPLSTMLSYLCPSLVRPTKFHTHIQQLVN